MEKNLLKKLILKKKKLPAAHKRPSLLATAPWTHLLKVTRIYFRIYLIYPILTWYTLITSNKPLFSNFYSIDDFCNFQPPVPITTANSSFQNKNWYNEVMSYILDLTWKKFLWIFFWEKSTFHFLNLSPALISIRALNDRERPRKGNNQSYRTDICIILVNLRHVSRCLERSRMAKMAKEWLDDIDPVSAPKRACMKKVM